MFNLLVVDDEKNARLYMEAVLKKNNYNVFTACDGKEALDILDREHIDLVLLDIMMPNMDGYEATKAIRSLSRGDAETIPIVAVTANAFAEDIQASLDSGMNCHIAKPLEVDEVYKTIARQLLQCRTCFQGVCTSK